MKDKIIKLFKALSYDQQVEVLHELSTNTDKTDPITIFVKKYQKIFRENPIFTITKTGPNHSPVIIATLISPKGTFEGKGSNQIAAKLSLIAHANAVIFNN